MERYYWILIFLQIKHFLCDWVFQTDHQIERKGIYGDLAGISHSLSHAISTICILFPFYGTGLAFGVGIADGITHYHIDWAKQNYCRVKRLTPSDKEFWAMIGLDQLLHQLTYIFIIAYLYVTT